MRMPRPTTIDFETKGIKGRPDYPPKPVGVAIKKWGRPARYYAWAHPTGNNCTKREAVKALKEVWKTPDGLLFHNSKFDADVAEEHMGMKRLPWDRYHDSVFMLFLDDPHSMDLGLKPSAEWVLGWPAEEQEEVKDWLLEHQPVPGVKISKGKTSEHYWAAYISEAPGGLVGKYAIGDVDRAAALFETLWKDTCKRGMLQAYNRERELMPILLENERQGVRIAVNRLRKDVKEYSALKAKIEVWIRRQLNIGEEVNLDSGTQVVEAMAAAGKLDLDLLGVTPTGKLKSDKESLKVAVKDPILATVLRYRTQLNTCLNTFMKPWLRTAEQTGGIIHTWWNQAKIYGEDSKSRGARTGRLSSSPNFQNIPNPFSVDFTGMKHVYLIRSLPPLPKVRGYIIPWEKGHVLIDRDYSQQELRILGHYEDARLLKTYLDDPWIDLHDFARDMINSMLHRNFKRKPIKNTAFGLIYGMGVGLLAKNSNTTVAEAREVKNAYLALFPGIKEMYAEMKDLAKTDKPLRTWGGREYYCEDSKLIDGRMVDFDYKMINVLIQGSAADCTKQALINYDAIRKHHHKFYLTVHDEFLSSVPRSEMKRAMQDMKEAMEDVHFDIPMLSEGTWSSKNWTSMKDYDKKGVLKYDAAA